MRLRHNRCVFRQLLFKLQTLRVKYRARLQAIKAHCNRMHSQQYATASQLSTIAKLSPFRCRNCAVGTVHKEINRRSRSQTNSSLTSGPVYEGADEGVFRVGGLKERAKATSHIIASGCLQFVRWISVEVNKRN